MFEELIALIGAELNKAAIPYMIIGGQALLLYGEPRLTKDIDITLGIDINQLTAMIELADKIGAKPIPDEPQKFVKQTYVLPVKTRESIRVDFIFSFTNYERQACERANKVMIRDVPVNFGRAEDIIIHKIFAGRPRDIEDVKSIVLKNPDLDVIYIRNWLTEFDKDSGENHSFVNLLDDILTEVSE